MKKIIFMLLALVVSVLTSAAQDDGYKILHECDTTVKAKLGSLTLGSREVKFFIYEYPSVNAYGEAATVSGVIMAPADIVSGSTPCDGIVMYNHYTIGAPEDAPSQGDEELTAISAMLSNPLKPNYIVVASDYIGYGSSIDQDIAYLSGDTNARNCLDGLLAARKLLSDKQIEQGKYLFNLGFSQGGTESMFAAKLCDMEEKYKDIRFDKTFSGGGPLDFKTIYSDYVERDQCDDIADVVLMLICVNENHQLGIDYNELFQEPMASKAMEYFKSKRKSVVSEIGVTSLDSISKVLQPDYMDKYSPAAEALMAKLKEISLSEGWVPDITKNYYIEHSRHDNYVPVQCVRGIIPWMKERGFKPSLVPGKTSLQTNMLVFKLKHQQSGIVWAVQTMAAIQFWPVVYYEGEQNRYYRDVVHDLNLMKVVKTLEKWGLDLRKLVNNESNAREFGAMLEAGFADGSLNPGSGVGQLLHAPRRADFLTTLSDALAKVDLTITDAIEMLDDSGITLLDILEVYSYITSPAATAAETPSALLEERVEAPLFLLRSYEQQLANWYLLGGFDVDYNGWGW